MIEPTAFRPDSHALDSTALITGAASGIGRALFAAFRQAGYRTIGVDCAPAEGVETLDVTDTAAVTAFAANLDALTVLVNAAGVIRLRQEYDPSEFMRVVDVNLTGTMRMAVACRRRWPRPRAPSSTSPRCMPSSARRCRPRMPHRKVASCN